MLGHSSELDIMIKNLLYRYLVALKRADGRYGKR